MPSSLRAAYLYFARRGSLERVDATDHLAYCRHVVRHKVDGVVTERAHSLRNGQSAELVLGCPPDNEPLNLRGDPQRLEHADAVEITGAGAKVAPAPCIEDVLWGSPGLLVERE